MTGVVDQIGPGRCAVEIESGNVVFIESRLCSKVSEGDTIVFYVSKH